MLLLPSSLLLLLSIGSAPCLKWRHAVNPSTDEQRVRASVAVIESGGGLQEVVALLANGSLISYSISISGAVGPSVDLGGPAAAAPVVLDAPLGMRHATLTPREACPSGSSELVAVLVGGNVTVVNAANMAICWSTRLVPSKIGSNVVPFSAGLTRVRPGVLVAALPAATSTASSGAGSGATRSVVIAGLRERDGLVLWRTTVGGASQPLDTTFSQLRQTPFPVDMLVSSRQLVFIATPGPASAVTAFALGSNTSQQPTTQWRWAAPGSSSVLAMRTIGDRQLAVGLSSGAVILLNSSSGGAATVWHEQVISGGAVTALTLAPEGWGTSSSNNSVLLVSTKEALADRSQPERGRVVAISVLDGGLLWAAAAPTPGAPLTAAGGCAPSAVSLHVPHASSSGPQTDSALLNGTTAVFGCPDSIHAVSNAGEVVWSLPLQQGIDSLAIGNQDGLIYGWSQGVTSIDASCSNSSDLQLCPAVPTSHPPCSCHKSCTSCVDAACAWVNDGVVTIQFWDSSTQKLRETTRSHMHFCWRGNMFTLAKSRTTHTDNRTVTVHTDYAPQYGQCTVNATFAVTFAVTVVFLLVCVTYVSFHLHFSTFGKNTLQKHYNGMVTRDLNHRTDSDSDSTSETEPVSRWYDADSPSYFSPPDSLITRLLEPEIPHGMDGQTPTITEDEAMFLLQKRLVVRQYKYVLYLQQMTYVLVLVLFYLNAVWIKIFPDAFLGPTVLAPISVVALRSEAQKWVNIAFFGECFSIFMRLYSTFSLVYIGINCVVMSPGDHGGCSAAFTTVFSVPFFVLAWYDLGFHVAALWINRDLYKLVMINKVASGTVQARSES